MAISIGKKIAVAGKLMTFNLINDILSIGKE